VDAALFTAINGAHAPWLDPVMTWVSWLGYFPGVWFLAAAAALTWPRQRAAAFRMCLAVALTYWVTSGVVKPLVARERPYMAVVGARTVEASPATGPSFPSGHTATAVAGALAGVRVVPGAGWALWALATLMSISRVYVGVHYPTDVVAGALIGTACAYFVLGGRHPATWPLPRSAASAGTVVRP
jgi:undecaprenyl-diphosphatase